MIVVMDIPHVDRLGSVGFAAVGAGVEQFLDQDPVVPFDLAGMARCVRGGVLVPAHFERVVEAVGAVAGPVVGDDPVNSGDAVRGEERAGPRPEAGRGRAALVIEGFGVGQAGEPVDRRVQVHVAGPPGTGFRPVGGQRPGRATAVDAPAPACGDAADLLDVDVHHVAGPAGVNMSGAPVYRAGGVKELAPVETAASQEPGHGAHRDLPVEFERDTARGPLVGAAQMLDPVGDGRVGGGGLVLRGARPVIEPDLAVVAPAVEPFRYALPR